MIHDLILPKKNKVNFWLLLGILRLDNIAYLEKVYNCLSFIVFFKECIYRYVGGTVVGIERSRSE